MMMWWDENYFNWLVQKKCNSSALAVEWSLSCINPSIYALLALSEGKQSCQWSLLSFTHKGPAKQNLGGSVVSIICWTNNPTAGDLKVMWFLRNLFLWLCWIHIVIYFIGKDLVIYMWISGLIIIFFFFLQNLGIFKMHEPPGYFGVYQFLENIVSDIL